MNPGEEKLCDWKHDRSGSFYKALFELIAKADGFNQARLYLGFPEEVKAFQRYHNEEGYWQKLDVEYQRKEEV